MPDAKLTAQNIDAAIERYCSRIASVGETIKGKKGLELFQALKRDEIGSGPYPNVTLFEAANRIMTDLVILYGVKWLLKESELPFNSYEVEYGHNNNNDFDIMASNGNVSLIAEAFNVAPSFFPIKKAAMLKKMREGSPNATYKALLINEDALEGPYNPRPRIGEFFVFISVGSGEGRLVPNNAFQRTQKMRR